MPRRRIPESTSKNAWRSSGKPAYRVCPRTDAATARYHAQRLPKRLGYRYPRPVAVDLALQGGGSHGAFTWGVLDRLLEETWLQFDGISGTSAGAMNAAVMAAGHATGGAPAARAALAAFWRKVSDAARLSPFRRGPLDVLLGRWTLEFSPAYIAMDFASRLFSPYDLNPAGRTRCARFWPRASTSAQLRERRSSCSSPPPTSIPAAVVCSAMRRSRPT